MKKGLFVVFVISVFTQVATAQTIKTGVLVIGNGNNAIGSGFQSAISGVKTTMLIQGADLVVSPPDKNISSGLEFQFLKKMRLAKGIQDSTSKVYIDGTSANSVLKTWADSIKNLTVLRNIKWSRIKRSGNNWNVLLEDGRSIKAEVIVNADGSGNVDEALGLKGGAVKQWQPLSYSNNLYRLSVSSGYLTNNTNANIILLNSFLLPQQENLVVLNQGNESFAGGQAAGATAAYAVFFKTKTSLSDLKEIQKELINHKLATLPFADVEQGDPNWKSIQFIGLSGFLKVVLTNGDANFYPEQAVSTAEVKEPIKEFYYKAQIWFDDYKDVNITVGAALNMICMVGNKAPENTNAEVQKKWKSSYHFKNEFDLNRSITRREFAVLVDEYLNPFKTNIDKTGRVIR
ncbi:MAG: hypothetical protein P0Y49_21200 [Candidatus Pedobacter colombiensis]|uniref:FAD-dependent oxidoreductase n=1 Tax=Candidatus Pedobacter colombiensis TaxID=3121371 RepID=A0AAJ5W719_9SPHI|nr:hypothetical protein [Pedobacter sp.]WEK19296.1 MAG: hypothetical protein P0Y49_21200 [Pedobacter sp.]